MAILLVLFKGLLLISTVESCADYLKKSLQQTNDTKFCSSVSSFANCIGHNHALMGSPFGTNMAEMIGQSVSSSVERLCAVRCQLNVVNKTIQRKSRSLLAVGSKLKSCVFDAIISSAGKKRHFCNKLEEMVRCMLLASTKENYLMTQEHIQTGMYILAEILENSFNVKCGKPIIGDIEDRLFQKCRGRFVN
ncbi:hypothetical protein Btru_064709 [Bulinus truncatus]|nr:hypothetical protein Btru_064709 [Bulinus truncatus]